MSPIFGSLASSSKKSISKNTRYFNLNTEVLLTTPGAGNWSKPEGVTVIQVECWGGGGAGGGATLLGQGGGGGAGGQYAMKILTYSSAQQSIPYVVAETVSGSINAGSPGNDTTWDTNKIVAKGGAGGEKGAGVNITSPGGAASVSLGVGDFVFAGGPGGDGNSNAGGTCGGGGGSCASADTTFFFNYFDYSGSQGEQGLALGPTDASGGIGPCPYTAQGGSGGNGIYVASGGASGISGAQPGGGGGGGSKVSGGTDRPGGAGGPGLIRITYNI